MALFALKRDTDPISENHGTVQRLMWSFLSSFTSFSKLEKSAGETEMEISCYH